MSTTLSSKYVITRIEHKCFSCLRKFPKETKMHYWSGIYEGEFNSVYSCMTCQEIMKLDNDQYNEGFPEGYVYKALNKGETPEQYLERIWKSDR